VFGAVDVTGYSASRSVLTGPDILGSFTFSGNHDGRRRIGAASPHLGRSVREEGERPLSAVADPATVRRQERYVRNQVNSETPIGCRLPRHYERVGASAILVDADIISALSRQPGRIPA